MIPFILYSILTLLFSDRKPLYTENSYSWSASVIDTHLQLFL